MSSVSIILDASLPTATLAATLASVRAQHTAEWTLYVASSQLDASLASDAADVRGDPRMRVVETDASGALALNEVLSQVTGDIVAWLPSGAIWEPDHLKRSISALTNGVDHVFSATADGPISRVLATLCAEDVLIESTLVFRPSLLRTVGLLDGNMGVWYLWDLLVRMLRAGTPRLLPTPSDGAEREITLDMLPVALADVLHLHARTSDLAAVLPGVAAQQTEVRRTLFGFLREGLPSLLVAFDRDVVAALLVRAADAVLAVGTATDHELMRVILDAAHAAGVRDTTLHHRRLHLLRTLNDAGAIVLACTSDAYPLDATQLTELAAALRQLGQHDDAARVVALMPDEARSVNESMAAVAVAAATPDVATSVFPAWLDTMHAGSAEWREAAMAYSVAGLMESAAIAHGRAATDGPLPSLPGYAPASAIRELDHGLAEFLNRSEVPGVPYAATVLEPSARQLTHGAFSAWLNDVLLASTQPDALTIWLSQLAQDTDYVDLAPARGLHAATAAGDLSTSRHLGLLADHALHAAQLRRTLGVMGAHCDIVTSTDDLLSSVMHRRNSVAVHAVLDAQQLPRLVQLARGLRSNGQTCIVVWSGTDLACLDSSDTVQTCLAAAEALGLVTSSLVCRDNVLVSLPLADAPRAHLLLSR